MKNKTGKQKEPFFARVRRLFDVKLLKFLIVGVINTFVGMAIMFGLYNLAHANYWISSAANYVLTSVLSYFLNKYFTFRSSRHSWRQVWRFAANILVCYGIAYGAAKPLMLWILSGCSETVRDNIAMLVGMCLFTGLNYLGQRFFAFAEEKR